MPPNPPAESAAPPTQSDPPQPTGAAEAPPTAAPPAASAVVNAERTEKEVKLEQELEVERVTRRQREQRIAQLEDENHRIKSIPKEKARPKARWTLIHPED